jgi:hypothetical protein
LILVKSGLSAEQAIALIKEKRGPGALRNNIFVKYIYDQEKYLN